MVVTVENFLYLVNCITDERKTFSFLWQTFERLYSMPRAMFMSKISYQSMNTRWQWNDIFSLLSPCFIIKISLMAVSETYQGY